jgi:hypothetical protein
VPSSVLGVLLFGLSSLVASASGDGAIELREKADSSEDGAKRKRLTDREIKKILIAESIAAYSGNCPCPYNTARNGSRCGRRSAHSRAGGEAPLCFESDITAEMVQRYREANPDA